MDNAVIRGGRQAPREIRATIPTIPKLGNRGLFLLDAHLAWWKSMTITTGSWRLRAWLNISSKSRNNPTGAKAGGRMCFEMLSP